MAPQYNILLTNSTDIYGGGEFFVLELAKALRKHGHNVWVSCKPNNLLLEKCKSAQVPVFPINFPSTSKLWNSVAMLKTFIQKHNIRLVHTNSNYDRTAGAFAARLGGARHVTNVHSFHSISHNITHWVRNQYATDKFIVDGVCVKELLMNDDGIPERKIAVLHLGVDPDTMKKDSSLRNRVRTEFGFHDEHIVIGNVGRLVPMKGQEFLLKAFAQFTSEIPNARILLVGDGELRETLYQLSVSLGIEKNISFAGFRDDLVAVYSAFDIYAHPSIEGGGETFPFAVLQALAEELPVVVTRVGDVPAMVEEQINGVVVPDRDALALAKPLKQLLLDPGLRLSMASQSRRVFLQKFTTEKMVDNVEAIYQEVLGNNQ